MVEQMRSREAFSRIGGHPALDLINTVQWRLSDSRRHDDLRDDDDAIRWALQVELLTGQESVAVSRLAADSPVDAQAENDRVRDLREAVYSALFEDASAEPLVDEYRRAVAQATLAPHDDHWGWDLPLDLALPRRRIALAAFDLLTRTDLANLSQCQDAECGWVFLDTSARKDRRWCVSSDCGNRNRVREYYARTRSIRAATKS